MVYYLHFNIFSLLSIVLFYSLQSTFLADPGKARGCSINSLVTDSLIQSVREPFPPTALRRRHAKTVRDRYSSYFIVIKNFLNPEGHQNPISGSKVTNILLKGWILPIGGTSAGEGLPCSLRSKLVFNIVYNIQFTIYSLLYTVYHLQYYIYSLLSKVYYKMSLFAVYNLQSTIYSMPNTVYHIQSTIYSLLQRLLPPVRRHT